MQTITQTQIELYKVYLISEEKSEVTVEKYIRERYSVSQEFAILRQREEKPEEFNAYYDYAESCKARAKGEVL